MKQPTPTVTARDVERIVRRDFPADVFVEVMAVLNEYGTVEWQHEPQRVRLAALKLADGSLDNLRRQIEWAKCDYRDVLAPAEYPEYTRQWSRIQQLLDTERDKIIKADWQQYNEWVKNA